MGLKRAVKQILIDREHRKYEIALKEKSLSYDKWIRKQEENNIIRPNISEKYKNYLITESEKETYDGHEMENAGKSSDFDASCRKSEAHTVQTIYYKEIEKDNKLKLPRLWADIVLIQMYEGERNGFAIPLILKEFAEHEDVMLIYGDEDVQAGGERQRPWFKPDWSPDRFLASFYFGALVAVRAESLREVWEKEQSPTLYLLLYHLIGSHGGFAKREREMPVFHVRQVLFHSLKPGYEQIKHLTLLEEEVLLACGGGKKEESCDPEPEISVIIPSKDHPEILFRCLNSFLERTVTCYRCDFIIVDNGSREENRRLVEKKLEDLNVGTDNKNSFRYFYCPMEFNFSKMCNMGAKEAKSRMLLFLNDDMEIIQPDWLDRMAQKALLPYVGAVGAKLLYPESSIIQHAGITNLRVGPAHKLQFLDDREEHYYGMNRGVHDMLGVTGACLLTRREVFGEAGGFFEGLAVAFNDVDLCYSIFEKGYYNLVRNDVVLYHHESLSRGKDGESKEKQLRLLREKDLLYERHQKIYGKDPFYHPYLTTDMLESGYSPACQYQVTLNMPWARVKECAKDLAGAREDSCLVVGMECAMDIYKWKYGVAPPKETTEDMGYYFQGYTFVIGSDNACYEKRLLLKNLANGKVYGISIDQRFRPDIKNNLSDQLNVDLTGFAAKMKCDKIPEGSYQFGMLAVDRCSRQRLINWSSWTLEIK